MSINERCSRNSTLIADIQYLHRSYFLENKENVPPNALKLIGKLINVDYKKLQFELISIF